MGVLNSTFWFIINLFIFFIVSAAGRKSTTKCNEILLETFHAYDT
jgi:hypothetical protein